MTIERFHELVEYFDDIMLDFNGKKLAIFTWPDEGILVCECDMPGRAPGSRRIFNDADEILDRLQFGGKPLRACICALALEQCSQIKPLPGE